MKLTTAQRRHLTEMTTNEGPYWYPHGAERKCAEALAEKGLIDRSDHSAPPRVYHITEEGRKAIR